MLAQVIQHEVSGQLGISSLCREKSKHDQGLKFIRRALALQAVFAVPEALRTQVVQLIKAS